MQGLILLLCISMPEHAYKIVTYTDITSVRNPHFDEVIMSRMSGPSLAQEKFSKYSEYLQLII